MKDKLFKGSTPAPAKRPGCVEFQGEAELIWAVAGDPMCPSPECLRLGLDPQRAVGVDGTGGHCGDSSAKDHARGTRTPTPQMALGVLSQLSLNELLAPISYPAPRAGVSPSLLPGWPRGRLPPL